MDRLDRNGNEDSEVGKSKFHFIQDAAVSLSVITGISYIMAFSFRKGMRAYYGITDLANNEISVSTVFQSINEMDLEVLLVAFAYVLIQLVVRLYAPFINISLLIVNKFYKWMILSQVIKKKQLVYNASNIKKKELDLFSKEERANITKGLAKVCTSYAFVLAILAVAPSIFLQDTFINLFTKSAKVFYYLLIPLPPICYLISKVIKKQTDFRDIVKIKNPISYLWETSNWNVKIAMILIMGAILSICFYSYGQQFASQKKDYLVVELNGENAVVLENNQGELIVAPLDLESKIVADNFSVIKAESDKDKLKKFKRVWFKDGLVILN